MADECRGVGEGHADLASMCLAAVAGPPSGLMAVLCGGERVRLVGLSKLDYCCVLQLLMDSIQADETKRTHTAVKYRL
eukprot:11204274-Lingulodinium_polyedra.AAC.1